VAKLPKLDPKNAPDRADRPKERARVASAKPTAREYRALVTARLAKMRPALIRDLQRRIFRTAFPPGTTELAFEVFFQDLGTLPIVGYVMADPTNQVMIVERDGTRSLAPNVEVLPKRAMISNRDAVRFDEAGVDAPSIHVPLVLRWFIGTWTAAGGRERFPLFASIQLHDGGRRTRLPSAARGR